MHIKYIPYKILAYYDISKEVLFLTLIFFDWYFAGCALPKTDMVNIGFRNKIIFILKKLLYSVIYHIIMNAGDGPQQC